jgi:hypothetical protein
LEDVGFHIAWHQGKISLQFGGTGLFGALGLQLAFVSTGTKALFICSECRTPFTLRAGNHELAKPTIATSAAKRAGQRETGKEQEALAIKPTSRGLFTPFSLRACSNSSCW